MRRNDAAFFDRAIISANGTSAAGDVAGRVGLACSIRKNEWRRRIYCKKKRMVADSSWIDLADPY